MNSVKPYSPREQDYIRRVAGKVPAEVMAAALGRTRNSLVNWANRHGISLRVPYGILKSTGLNMLKNDKMGTQWR